MKKLFPLLLLLPSFLFARPIVIGLGGQSNAVGQYDQSFGIASELNSITGATTYNCQSSAWETLSTSNNSRDACGNNKGRAGIELRLMYLLVQQFGAGQKLLKFAVSGSGLDATATCAVPGGTGTWAYNDNIWNGNAAYYSAAGATPDYYIWIQGEADGTCSTTTANNYEANLRSFISRIRTLYGKPNLPFLVVRLSNTQTSVPYLSTIRTAQQNISTEANNYLVDADGASNDGLHYDGVGYDTLAKRVYRKIQSLATTNLIVFDGNSQTAGVGQSSTQNGAGDYINNDYPSQAYRLLFPSQTSGGIPTDGTAITYTNYTFYNFGVSGQTTNDMASDAATQIDALYSGTNASNTLVAWEITNALAVGNKTAQQAYDDFKSYCLARKAAGWKVIVLTILPRTSFFYGGVYDAASFETARTTVNGLLRSHYTDFADALVDIADNSSISRPDGTHPDNGGYAIIAAAVKAQIDAVISGGSGGGGGGYSMPVKFKRYRIIKMNVALLALLAFVMLFSSCKKEDLRESTTEKIKVEWEAESNGATYTVEGSADGKNFYPVATSTKDNDTLIVQSGYKYFRVKGDEKGTIYYTQITKP